ncbi:NUDIX domain-containing protein [Novosphingobium sp. FSY-8]|uniref:NUDIX domain-containing protein n=1 Tax=Novosphingobium ovatum TaxID=1908523 RepID=A0ABW9XDR5_9SPHN|nr:NUDIX domain-containing protein [Novosphingobium ovatum]NBC36665.1 NUDIX domain-containing protein [Novosphingobium ovatum]
MTDTPSFPPMAVTVDLVLMSLIDGQLAVLLQRRDAAPFAGQWVLPGGFVAAQETLDDAARRVLTAKAGLASERAAWLEQLYTFGAPGRDPRLRVVSVAYFALLPAAGLTQAVAARDDLALMPIEALPAPLGFDHDAIVALALERLRGKLAYTPIALALLPARFTLRDLQAVHEAIAGTRFHKPAFRRRMLDSGWITPTGTRETETAFRPAELYRQAD